jgi:hypothetical protein
MFARQSLRWAPAALIVVAVVTGCSGARGSDGGQSAEGDGAPMVPVVTSVVGQAPPSSSTTAGAPRPTPGPTAAPTTTVPADFGESDQPIAAPTTGAAAADPTVSPVAEAAARNFLERYWAPGARTSAQVADAVAPFATDRLLALYRDPARADQAIPGAGVGDITVQATQAGPTSAVVTGRGTMVDEPDRRVVYRTLNLVPAADGTWRVDVIR